MVERHDDESVDEISSLLDQIWIILGPLKQVFEILNHFFDMPSPVVVSMMEMFWNQYNSIKENWGLWLEL